jgi:hypothetical protein
MSLTSPTLAELQSCRDALGIMYVNGIMDQGTYRGVMANLNAAIDARIGA